MVWPMAEFTAARATVHNAIGSRDTLPTMARAGTRRCRRTYVPCAHDPALRRDIEQAAAKGRCRPADRHAGPQGFLAPNGQNLSVQVLADLYAAADADTARTPRFT